MITSVFKWFLLAVLGIVFTVLSIVLSPVLSLFVQPSGYLPKFLTWFQTPDAPAWGDANYQANQMAGVSNKWWMATCWLARNPGYGFDVILGAPVLDWFTYASTGNEATSNSPLCEGKVLRTLTLPNGPTYWQFYLVQQLTSTKCLKLNLGWKLWGTLESGQRRSLVSTCNPFTKFTA